MSTPAVWSSLHRAFRLDGHSVSCGVLRKEYDPIDSWDVSFWRLCGVRTSMMPRHYMMTYGVRRTYILADDAIIYHFRLNGRGERLCLLL